MKKGGRKRLSEGAHSTEESQKQSRLEMFSDSKQVVSQHTLDKLVTTFVVEGLHSFSIVEEKAFKDLVEHLAPGRKTLTRRMLTDRLDSCFEDMKQKLSLELINVDHIAVSADLWSSFHRCVLYHGGSLLERYTVLSDAYICLSTHLFLQELHWHCCLVVKSEHSREENCRARVQACHRSRNI